MMKKNLIYKSLRELFLASKTLFVLSYFFTFLQGISRIFPIVTIQLLFDTIEDNIQSGNLYGVVPYLCGFVGARILCHIIDLTVNYLYEYYNMVAACGMEQNVNQKVFSLKGICFERTEMLETINKAYRGTGSIRKFLDTWLFILFLYLPETVVILAYLYRANRFLPLVLLCILLPSIAVLRLEEREFSDKEEKTAALQRKIDIFDRLAFDVRNIIETKVLGYEPLLCGKAGTCIAEKSALEFQYRKKKNLLEHAEKCLTDLGHISVFAVLVFCAYNSLISIGVFAALVTTLDELFDMISEMLEVIAEGVSEEMEKIRNYFKLMEETESISPVEGEPLSEAASVSAVGSVPLSEAASVSTVEGEPLSEAASVSAVEGVPLSDAAAISVADVSFRYPGSGKNALEHISFCVKKGEHIAVVGENGSGKSTLMKLLCGIYDCSDGEIQMNGLPLSAIPKKSVYRSFTAVFQNFGKYAMNLSDNIQLAERPDADRMAQVRSFHGLEHLKEIPEDEILSREFGGTDLSGGEWQKVAIARAIYRSGDIFLLDEPTSAIDPAEEDRLYRIFGTITRGRTSFLVTHRMSAARLAEKILVLDAGRLCAFGTHEELLESCEVYRRLWNSQAKIYQAHEM
jgi:ATP-binding cassette subfamily B protein